MTQQNWIASKQALSLISSAKHLIDSTSRNILPMLDQNIKSFSFVVHEVK